MEKWKMIQALILSIKDKGLVVITGCGHSGIINILKYAMGLTGSDRIYAVVGGMHLTGGTFEPIIPRTIDELERLKPRFIIPCHCSGLKVVNEIVRTMPSAFIQREPPMSFESILGCSCILLSGITTKKLFLLHINHKPPTTSST